MSKKEKTLDIRKGGISSYRDLQQANLAKFISENPEYEDDFKNIMPTSISASDPRLLETTYFNTPLVESGSYWGESKYDPTTVSSLEDIFSEDGGLYADRMDAQAADQSTWEKWLNGIGKHVVLAGTSLLDASFGILAGISEGLTAAMSGEDFSDITYATINNPISRDLHEIQKWSEEVMPNYRTYEEANAPWWERLGTANFWADDVFKNAGYFTGAYLSGLGTSKLLSSLSSINASKNIFKGVATAALDDMSSMQLTNAFKNGEAVLNGEKLTKSLIDLGKESSRKAFNIRLASGIVGSIGESRMEALMGSEEDYNYRYKLLNKDRESKLANIDNEIPDIYWEYTTNIQTGERTKKLTQAGEEYKQNLIKDYESKYTQALNELADERKGFANSSFFMNLLVTSIDNIYQFGDAFTGGFKQTRQLASIKRLTDGTYKASKKGVIKDVMGALGSPVFEGTQEMLQRNIQIAGEKWNATKFNEFYGQALDPKALDSQANYLTALGAGFTETFGNLEEWENFVLGALTTMIFPLPGNSFYGGFKEAKQNSAYSKGLAEGLNAIQNDDTKKEWLLHLNRLGVAGEIQMQALEENDVFAFKNAETDKIISSVITYSQAGRFQDFLDLVENAYNVQSLDIESLRAVTKDKNTGISPYEKMTDKEIIELFAKNKKQAIENAEKIHRAYTSLQESFGGSVNPKYLNTLTYLTASIDNREQRIESITQDLIKEINNDIQAFEETFGYSPVERLKNIHDLKRWFAEEDKKELFDNFDGNRTKKGLQKLESKRVELSKKQQKNIVKLLQQKSEYVKTIKKLEEKQTSAGISNQEEKTLQNVKGKLKEIERKLPKTQETISDLKKFVAKTSRPLIEQQEFLTKLDDLQYLLAERELLIDSINQLQKTPTIFEDSLNRDLVNAVNGYNNRIALKDYNKIKDSKNIKNAIIETLNKQKTSLNSLINIAEENNDEQMKKELKNIKDLISKDVIVNEIFDPETTDLPINDTTVPYIELIKNTIKEAIYASNSIEETDANITRWLEDLSIIGKRSYSVDQQMLDDLISQVLTELKNIKKTKEGVSKSKTKDDTKDNTPKSDSRLDSLYKIKKRKNFEDFIRNKTEEELKELIINAGLEEEFVDEDNDITWDDYPKQELEDKLIGIINKLPEQTVEETVKEDKDVTPPDSPANNNEDEEVFPTKGKVTSEQSKGGFSSRTEILPPSKLSGTVKNQIVGTNEEGSVDENKSDDIKDAWHGNRDSAKYQIKKLKDGTLEIVSDDYQWYTKYLLANGINHQEFIDSGELQRLKEWHEERGEKLRVRFIIPGSVRATSKEGKAYNRPLNDMQDDSWWENYKQHYAGGFYSDTDLLTFKNIVQSQTIFLAVEKPKDYNASKDTFTTDVLSIDGHRKVQLIGVLDKTSQDLRDALKTDTKGLDAHLRMSSIATELEWVYSGRLVKENSTFEKGEHDLKDVLPEGSAEGVIQIEIVTQSDNLTIGENLPGTVVPLNTNREKIVISNKSDRYGTIWMKTREADGRVYYKGVKIKEFNNSYEETNTAVYKGIKGAVKALIQADTSETSKNALSLLRRYLYLGSGKTPLYKDVNSDTIIFNDTGETIDTSELNEETINNVIDALKRRSYTFSVGLNDLTLDEIIQSNILTTDLAQIHNANSSFIISKVVFDDKGDWWINPSNDVETKIKKGIHTGKKGLQPARGFVNRVKTEDGQIYSQRDDGLWTVYENGEYVVVDDKLTANEKFKLQFLVDLQYGKLGSTKLYYHDANKKKVKVWQRQNPNKANTLEYLDERGHFLTPEEAKALKERMKSEKGSKKKAAADAKLKAIHADKTNPPIETTPESNEEVNEEANSNIEEDTKEIQEEEPVIKSDDSSTEPEIFKIGEEENVVKSTGNPVLDAIIKMSANDDVVIEYIDDSFDTYDAFETSLTKLVKENKVSEDALNKYLEFLKDGETDSAIKLLDDIINCRI